MTTRQVNDESEVDPQRERSTSREPSGPFPIYTYTLLGCIAVVFAAQFLTSNDPEFFALDRFSSAAAGFDKRAFLNGHEYWRILTGATIHSGFLHVAMNSYALYTLGRLIEFLSNKAHVATVFILSALGGGLLGLIFSPDTTSVGASGGIVGLLSYLAVYAFKRRNFISAQFRKSLLINIGFILIFGLVLFKVIDNFAHVGGLMVGAIYGYIQVPRDEKIDPRIAGSTTRLLGLGAVLLYILTSALAILLLVNAQ